MPCADTNPRQTGTIHTQHHSTLESIDVVSRSYVTFWAGYAIRARLTIRVSCATIAWFEVLTAFLHTYDKWLIKKNR